MPSSKRKSSVEPSLPPISRNKNSVSNTKPATPESVVQRAATFPQKDASTRFGGASYTSQAGSNYYDQSYLQNQQNASDADAFGSPEPTTKDKNGGANFNRYNHSGAGGGGGLAAPGYNIPDLSAIMFSSTDPFAYPNQPMMTLEENAGFASASPQGSTNMSTPNRNTTAMSSPQVNLYGSLPRGSISSSSGLEAQLLDPLQPYLTVDYGQVPRGATASVFSAEMGLGIDECDMAGLVKEETFSGNEQQWWGQGSEGGMAGNAAGTGGWAI